MNLEMLLAQLAEILGLEPAQLTVKCDLAEKGWDSLSQLEFISRMDSLGLPLNADELARAQTVEDLFKLVS